LIARTKLNGMLERVKAAYYKKYGKSLVQRVSGETSGDYKRILAALIGGN
jgi:hypothetical protein